MDLSESRDGRVQEKPSFSKFHIEKINPLNELGVGAVEAVVVGSLVDI